MNNEKRERKCVRDPESAWETGGLMSQTLSADLAFCFHKYENITQYQDKCLRINQFVNF